MAQAQRVELEQRRAAVVEWFMMMMIVVKVGLRGGTGWRSDLEFALEVVEFAAEGCVVGFEVFGALGWGDGIFVDFVD